jgi:hypothetical protein
MNPSDSSSSPSAVQPDGGDSYRPELVEAKWQARWAERHTNEPDLDGADRPFYNLMMFPYPSPEGLHVGHVRLPAATSQFQRLRGANLQADQVQRIRHLAKLRDQAGHQPGGTIPRNTRTSAAS